MDKFSQLVDDLTTGELSLTQVRIAIKASIRQRKDIPEEIKDLLCGRGRQPGLIHKIFAIIPEMIGTMELAYRRGRS